MARLDGTPKRMLAILTQSATFAFLCYVLFLLGRSAWTNAKSNQQLDALKTDIAVLKSSNQDLGDLILYQQTATFKDLEARQQLGLKKPGELVIALPTEPITTPTIPCTAQDLTTKSPSTIGLWWKYFFS